jgi:hypothetical protein
MVLAPAREITLTGIRGNRTDVMVNGSGSWQAIWPAGGGMHAHVIPGDRKAAIGHETFPAGAVSAAGLMDAA